MLEKLEDLVILDNKAIGEGAYSKVVRCRLRGGPQLYALKIVD